MLDSLYRQLFRPHDTPPSDDAAALIGMVLLLVMTFNAASSLQVSAAGVSSLLIVFGVGGCLGLFWFTASILTLSSLWGSTSSFQSLFSAILIGLWPLIFTGAAISAQQGFPPLGALLSLAIVFGTLVTLSHSLARVQSTSLWQALALIFVTLLLSILAIGGVIIWPMMLLLGL